MTSTVSVAGVCVVAMGYGRITARRPLCQRRMGTAAGATDVALDDFPADLTVLSLASNAFQIGFNLKKSNGELKKQSIQPGAIQLNGEKLTDPNAAIAVKSGDILRLSKKHTVKFQ